MMKGKIKYGFMACLLLAAVSCRTGKEATAIALPSLSREERIEGIVRAGLAYDDLSSALKLSLRKGEGGKETSVDAQMRIVRGEGIQISVRVPILGSEAFRVVIGPERVLIVDRMNKQYLSADTEFALAQAFVDFDYYALEALLTNRLFLAGKKEIGTEDYAAFRVRKDKYRAYLSCSDRQKITYDFESDYTNRIQAMRIGQENSVSYLQCDYADWGLTSNNRMFPMTLDLKLHTPNDVYRLGFLYKSPSVDTGARIDASIPNRYREVSWEQAIRLIKSLL
jgi:hypothetical protein